MSTDQKDFDAIALAMKNNDFAELDRLMAVEEELEEKEEVVNEEAEDTDSAIDTDETNADDADDESDTSLKVDNGETDEVEESTEAAPPAASTAPKVVDKELELEIQRLRSDAGRVPFLQRKMAELEREVRAHKARESQTTQGKIANVNDVKLDEETQREIDELREVDPVMARTLERVAKAALATATSQANQVVETFTKADEEAEEFEFLMNQKAELVREIPQADQIFATPEWRQWKDTLTPGQRALAESSYATEVKQAIYAFAAAMQSRTAPVVQAANPAAPVANEKLKEDRARKVGASAEVRTSAAKKAEEFDEAKFFEETYNKIGKANHILKS